MKSRTGFYAAIAFLLALPLAILVQVLFGSGADITVHMVCGVGFALSAIAAFDFKLPRWITWIGFSATSALAVIFVLQGLSDWLQNDSLRYLAYQVFGQWPEKLLADAFIFWFAALLLFDSRGKTRIFGFAALTIVIFYEVYTYSLLYLGGSAAQSFKLLYFLAFIWFLFESRKKVLHPGNSTIRNEMNGVRL